MLHVFHFIQLLVCIPRCKHSEWCLPVYVRTNTLLRKGCIIHNLLALLLFSDVREQMKLVDRGVSQKEPRFINRAARSLQSLRKKTNDNVLRRLIMAYYPPSESNKITVGLQ